MPHRSFPKLQPKSASFSGGRAILANGGAAVAMLSAFLGFAGAAPADRDMPLVFAGAATGWTPLGDGVDHRDVTAETGRGSQRLRAWRFDPERWRLRIVPAPEHGFSVHRIAPDYGLAVNGGYFDYRNGEGPRTLVPTGLVIATGEQVRRYGGGSGVLFDTGRGIGISWASDRAAWAGAEQALQAGPLLVDPGGRIGINRKNGPRARRSAICVTDSGEVIVVVVSGGITLYELAGVLAAAPPGGYGCERAINLDGGPSTQVFGRFGDAVFDVPGLSAVVNAVVFEPRE